LSRLRARDGLKSVCASLARPRLSPRASFACSIARARRSRTHRVPDLQFHLLARYAHHARAELNADRQVVHGLELSIGELQQQARFPNAWAENETFGQRRNENVRGPRSSSARLGASTRGVARTGIADDDVFEEVGVRHVAEAKRAR